jgi:hypothetical protein
LRGGNTGKRLAHRAASFASLKEQERKGRETMMKFFDRRNLQQRRLVGLGIPLVGGFLLLLLLRWVQGGEVFAYVVIMLLAGAGSFLIARGVAIVMTPLLVLGGFLLSAILQGADLDLLVEWIQRFSPLFLSVALVGAMLGVGISTLVRRYQRDERKAHLASPMMLPPPKPTQAQVPLPSQQEEQHAAVPAEQDDIARVLAQMQQEYAKAAKPHEPNNGTHQTRL